MHNDALLGNVKNLLGNCLGVLEVSDLQLGSRLAVALQPGLPSILLGLLGLALLLDLLIGHALALVPIGQCCFEFIRVVVVVLQLGLRSQRDRLGLSRCRSVQLGFEFLDSTCFLSVCLTQLTNPLRRTSRLFGRWRFLTNGDDHFVGFAIGLLVVFVLVVLVSDGFMLIAHILRIGLLVLIVEHQGFVFEVLGSFICHFSCHQ